MGTLVKVTTKKSEKLPSEVYGFTPPETPIDVGIDMLEILDKVSDGIEYIWRVKYDLLPSHLKRQFEGAVNAIQEHFED